MLRRASGVSHRWRISSASRSSRACLRTLRECCPRWCHQSCDEEAPQYSPSLGIADGWELQYESRLCRLTGPLNERKTLLYRLNLGYENSDTFRDLQKLTTQIVAPSITYLPSDRTRLNVDLVYTSGAGKLDRGVAIFGDGDLFSRPISSTQSAANDYLREQTLNLTFALSHQLAEGLLFNST